MLGLSADEMKLLAKHMGHDLNIHVDHYELQTDLLERTKVAKLLTAVYHGKLGKQPTKTQLSSISIDDAMIIDEGEACMLATTSTK